MAATLALARGDAGALRKDLLLVLADDAHELRHTLEACVAPFAQVAPELGKHAFVGGHEQFNSALANLEGGHVGQEVVATEETHEDEVVDQPLFVILKGQVWDVQLQLQVLAQSLQHHDLVRLLLELLRSRLRASQRG